MTQLLQEITDRLDAARDSLAQARLDGDDYLIQVRTGEIESLQRLFDEHAGDEVIVLEGRPVTTLNADLPQRATAS